MQRNKVLEALIRRDPVTVEDWYTFLEWRRQDMVKHMKATTLQTLGEISFLHDYFGTHHLKRDLEYLETDTTDLEIRGIFPDSSSWAGFSHVEHDRDGSISATASHHSFWGINRDGKWMLIRVYATHSNEPYKYAGRTERVQRARQVRITFPEDVRSICETCNITPRKIWERLGAVLNEWINQREEWLRQLRNLQSQFCREVELINSVPTT